jgi:hypothetical protein
MPPFETVLSVVLLGSFIWALRFLLPKAIKQHEVLAVTCAVLTAVLALLALLFIGVGVGSANL